VGNHLMLESGLEHDLVRVLDRDPEVLWLVPQPLLMEWGAGNRSRHVPDLLSLGANGAVTVWDIKTPQAATSAAFVEVQQLTGRACKAVGWRYKTFSGMPTVQRHNLLWLHSYRSRPAWADQWETELLARAEDGCALARLVGPVSEQTAVTWHLIWTGRLRVDLTSRLTALTEVRAA
jgi:hypothetical protein